MPPSPAPTPKKLMVSKNPTLISFSKTIKLFFREEIGTMQQSLGKSLDLQAESNTNLVSCICPLINNISTTDQPVKTIS